MKTSKSIQFKLRTILIILGVSIGITFIFAGFDGGWQAFLLNILYGILIGGSISAGSVLISIRMFSKGDWINQASQRLTRVILYVSLFIITDVLIINTIWFSITQGFSIKEFLNTGQTGLGSFLQSIIFVWTNAIELIIGLVIYLIIISRKFARQMQLSYEQSERDRKEIERFRYERLKSQINPHFLFNTLNVLSGLIYEDAKKADEVVGRLAEIYRYVLEVQNEEVVPVERELHFAEVYLDLLKKRFGDKLHYGVDADEAEGYIVPMALQLLIENSIKHNKMSRSEPLRISIETRGDKLEVSNSYHPSDSPAQGYGIGLDQLTKRYSFLSSEPVVVRQSDNQYRVSIPLLKSE